MMLITRITLGAQLATGVIWCGAGAGGSDIASLIAGSVIIIAAVLALTEPPCKRDQEPPP